MSTSSNFNLPQSTQLLLDDEPPFNGDFKVEPPSDVFSAPPLSPLIKTEKEIPKRTYEVFLSFRGEDTRTSFTSHLHAALQNAAINVFIDDRSLQRGDQISDSLLLAIEESQISIIVFSTNYADSAWCLQELEKIMECHRTIGQIVLPVFYDVDPSEVRLQTGEFGNAFENLLRRLGPSISVRAITWIESLTAAASLAGFVVPKIRNENVATKDIVDNVTRLLDKRDLFTAQNPVGVETRAQDVIQLLDLNNEQSNDVRLLGIWGMGGAGKTTIAKEIYNKIGRHFEGRSFLGNIREVWEQSAGQVYLQERLLFDIYKETTPIQSSEAGKILLKHKLYHRKVLLILDDVNSLDQLNVLCGSRQWFGSGSRIIITTRDKNLLTGDRVDHVYIMEKLNDNESIELFSWHAFKQESPTEEFVGISREVVEYSGGLPLALEVLGSYLFKRGVIEWKCVLEKLKSTIPNVQIHKQLRISYDGLDDDTEKGIFLDICCFFIGMDKNDVIRILNGCGLFAEIGINVLIERSLVTLDYKNRLGMHDLVRDMGRAIIREESPQKPENRSRLWLEKDVFEVLSEQTGTEAVEGLSLKLPSTNEKCFSTKAFKKMMRLRLLLLDGVQLDGDFKYLSKKLRWLSWDGFPLTCIPTSFYQQNLVAITLKNSNLELVWKEAQRLEMLKILNLSHSHYLKQSPDFSNMPNLEKLVLKDCPMLSDISDTIGHLNKVLLINLEDCISLHSLPKSFYKLKSLEILILSGCPLVDKLEEDFEQMDSLKIVTAKTKGIDRLIPTFLIATAMLRNDTLPPAARVRLLVITMTCVITMFLRSSS